MNKYHLLIYLFILLLSVMPLKANEITYNESYLGNKYFLNGKKISTWKIINKMKVVASDNPAAIKEIQNGKKYQYLAYPPAFAGGLLIGYEISRFFFDDKISGISMGGGTLLIGLAYLLNHLADRHIESGINIYKSSRSELIKSNNFEIDVNIDKVSFQINF